MAKQVKNSKAGSDEPKISKPAPTTTLADIKSNPDHLFDPAEVAAALRLHVDTVYRLGASAKLVRRPVGPNAGKTKFLGRDVLKYIGLEAA